MALLPSTFSSLSPYLFYREHKAHSMDIESASSRMKIRVKRERREQLGVEERSFANPKLQQGYRNSQYYQYVFL